MGSLLPPPRIHPASGYCSGDGIYYSKRTPVSLPPHPFLNLPSFILQFSGYDERTAFIDASTGRTLQFHEVRLRIRAVAAGLAGYGVLQGDVVFLLLPNSIHFSVIMLGAMAVGGVITATNPLNTPREIAKQMKDSGAKFVCTTPAFVDKVKGFGLPLILIGEEAETAAHTSPKPSSCISLSQLLASDPSKMPIVRVRQQDTAALLYSSGTTGASKGVIITHSNLIALISILLSMGAEGDWSSRVYLCLIPLFHIYGLALLGCGLLARGCTAVIMSKFDMEGMLAVIQRFRVTHAPVVPPILVALAKSSIVEKYDLSSLREVGSGSAPLSKEVVTAFRARFPNVPIVQGYGLTESAGVGANLVTEEECEHHSSAGLLAPNTEAKIVDIDSGISLPPNKKGELWLRGPTIMKGYFGNPGATAATIDSDGWLQTGDLCYFDDEGYLYVVDRLKELIKYKGLQVAPAELEAILLSHPEILDAAVIPLPDEEAGQIPMAFVVRRPESRLQEVDVMNFVAEQVAPYKKIRRVAFVNIIPKSAAGKILRRDLIMQASSKL